MTSRERFEEIYDAYSGVILAYARRRVESPEDAADIMAETFTVAWRRIHDVPSGEDARPWLHGVARRVLANQRRSTKRRLGLNDVLELETVHVSESEQDSIVDDAAARDALSLLSDQDRELLTLVAWDGLTSSELAVALGCTAVAVRVRLHRARRRFEKRLGEAGCNT